MRVVIRERHAKGNSIVKYAGEGSGLERAEKAWEGTARDQKSRAVSYRVASEQVESSSRGTELKRLKWNVFLRSQ